MWSDHVDLFRSLCFAEGSPLDVWFPSWVPCYTIWAVQTSLENANFHQTSHTKDKECFPKSTGRFFSWQNILLRGESGWHRFLSCALYSWPEIHGLKRENADVDGSTPISEFCVPSMYFSLRMSFGTQILASRTQKKETCYFSRIASPVSLISAHFS